MNSRIEQVLEAEQRRGKKIETLIALLKDSDIKDFVDRLTGEQGAPSATSRSTNGFKRKGGKTAHADGITVAIRALGPKLPDRFHIHDIVKALEDDGFRFKPNRKPVDQARDSLYFIAREDGSKFRVVERGRAGKLSYYEYRE